MVMVAWVAEFVIALSSGRDASVLHHKTAKDKGKNRTLVDQNMLLRITFKCCKYAFENHNQECKYADENQFRLRGQADLSVAVLLELQRLLAKPVHLRKAGSLECVRRRVSQSVGLILPPQAMCSEPCGVSLAHRFDMSKDAHPFPRAESFPLDRGSVATCSISIVKAWVSFVLDEYLECVA